MPPRPPHSFLSSLCFMMQNVNECVSELYAYHHDALITQNKSYNKFGFYELLAFYDPYYLIWFIYKH